MDTLSSGAQLLVNQSITSADGRFSLILQSDGNLVLYRGNFPLWDSKTAGKPSKNAIMQADGNFVVYDNSGTPLFNSGTMNHPGAILKIQDDGNVVIYQGARALWSTQTDGTQDFLVGKSFNAKVPGVLGENDSAPTHASDATTAGRGVVGNSSSGIGVLGQSDAGVAVYGNSRAGTGVQGNSTSGIGVSAESNTADAVHGNSRSTNAAGVSGFNLSTSAPSGPGVLGHSSFGAGVVGDSDHFDGVFGVSRNLTAAGVSGHNPGGLAGFFDGNVTVTGNLTTNGDIFLPGADCAEHFDIASLETIEPGTVMSISENGALEPSRRPYDKKVAGVISGAGKFKSGVILDKQESESARMPIALIGKVYCKVDTQYSSIEVGDLLTTSPTPGHAMKADDPFKAFGAVIGKALRPLETGQGLIPILIALQ